MKRKLLLSLLGFFIIILSNAQVKISEVYFDSNFDEGIGSNDHHYGEFIELYNRSNQSIDLSNWILTDNVGGMSLPQGTIIEPQGFIVITYGATTGTYANIFSSLFPEAQGHQSKTIYQRNIEFNNKGDYIILKDNTGKVIDQLYYSKSDLCKGLGANTTGYCYKTTIDNQFGGSYTTAINKDYTYSIQRQNFDNNSLLVAAKATPFSLIITDNYSGTGGTGSSGSSGSTNTAPTFTDDNYIYSRTYLTPVTSENPSAQQIQAIQYFDGLGRPKQSIAIKATPKGNDLVTTIVYDGFGRNVDSYLPVSMASTNGAIQSLDSLGVINYYSSPRNTTTKDFDLTDIKPFSHKELELSPLDRINKQYQVGNDWSTKPVNFGYDANGTGEVKKFIATFNYSTFTSFLSIATASDYVDTNGFYKENQLYKNTVTDEDGNVSLEFKNGQGQTLLVRKVLNPATNESADTYYVYNDYDQLAFVIPPLAAEKFKNLGAGTVITIGNITDLEQLCYQYKYDAQNRLVEKKLPGKGWEYMVYDKQDRLVATQDANMRVNNHWLFTKYDKFGRVAYTGIATGTSRTAEQTSADAAQSNYVERKTSIAFNQNGLDVYYGNPTNITSYPNTITTLLSVNYYDEYPTGISYQPTTIESQTVISSSGKVNLKGLPVASFVKNIEDNGWTKTYTYYDQKARPIGTHSDNYLGGYTRTSTKLKFSGKPEYTLTYHKKADRSDVTTIKETFEYDNQERVTKHWHQVNSTGNNELLAENIYNEIGQLQSKKVGGNSSTPLQNVDYSYNIRGWMTQINNPANLGADLFGFQIRYNNPDTTKSSPTAKYNGNISQTNWATASDGGIKRTYTYQYDNLNRLISSRLWDQINLDRGEYQENLSYDLNGNISTLFRSGKYPSSNATAPETMDNLKYNYENGSYSNKLSYLKEQGTGNNLSGYPLSAGQTGQVITYDANGNMTSQKDKNISSISYNFLNLPVEVKKPTTSIKYIYNSDGNKIKKISSTKILEYFDEFQYENNILQFVPTAEGYYDFVNKKYIYNYYDQNGNVRLSYYRDSNMVLIIDKEINYYPFGLEHNGYNNINSSLTSYKRSYQGQEKQEETDWLSFKWRNYDPTFARFFNVDPLSEKFTYNGVYNFSENRVIDGRELEGLEFMHNNDVDNAEEIVNMVAGTINQVRASVSNTVIRGANLFRDDNNQIRTRLSVDNEGSLVITENAPKETTKEKILNTGSDALTIILTAVGGPEGALMSQGAKAPALKTVQEVSKTAKLSLAEKGTKGWNEAVQTIKNSKKSDVLVNTASDAKSLLKEARGNMDRYKNYSNNQYKKGYEVHNSKNVREKNVGNDKQHIKWKDGKSSGHIFYKNPN